MSDRQAEARADALPFGRAALLIALLLSVGLALVAAPSTGRGEDRTRLAVAFIDVGQGDSAWLHVSDGTDILIDGGPVSAGPTVVAYLQANDVDDIEVMVVTHAHVDHYGGLVDVLRSAIPVESVLYNGQVQSGSTYLSLLTEMQRRGLTPTPASVGQEYGWGAIKASVLNPREAVTGDPNEDSVVLLIAYGTRRFLFTGDIGSSTEQRIVALGTPVASDVLKVAHHGSRYSSSASFLSRVSPVFAIISVGAGNPYGHPTRETLDRLQASGALILRTDERGTIVVTSDGQTLEVPARYVVFLPLVSAQGSSITGVAPSTSAGQIAVGSSR